MIRVKYFTYDDDGLVVVYENKLPTVPREKEIIRLRNAVYRIVGVFWLHGDALIWVAEEKSGYGCSSIYADIYAFFI